jgi:hypothetical protein
MINESKKKGFNNAMKADGLYRAAFETHMQF